MGSDPVAEADRQAAEKLWPSPLDRHKVGDYINGEVVRAEIVLALATAREDVARAMQEAAARVAVTAYTSLLVDDCSSHYTVIATAIRALSPEAVVRDAGTPKAGA